MSVPTSAVAKVVADEVTVSEITGLYALSASKLPYSAPLLETAGQWQVLTLARSFPIGIGTTDFTSSQNDGGF